MWQPRSDRGCRLWWRWPPPLSCPPRRYPSCRDMPWGCHWPPVDGECWRRSRRTVLEASSLHSCVACTWPHPWTWAAPCHRWVTWPAHRTWPRWCAWPRWSWRPEVNGHTNFVPAKISFKNCKGHDVSGGRWNYTTCHTLTVVCQEGVELLLAWDLGREPVWVNANCLHFYLLIIDMSSTGLITNSPTDNSENDIEFRDDWSVDDTEEIK